MRIVGLAGLLLCARIVHSSDAWDLQDDWSVNGLALESDRCTIERVDIMAGLKKIVDELSNDSGEHSSAAMEMYRAASANEQEAVADVVPPAQHGEFREYFNTFRKAETVEAEVGWALRKKLLMAKVSLQDNPVILQGLLDAQEIAKVWKKDRFNTEFGAEDVSDNTPGHTQTFSTMGKFVTTLSERRDACSQKNRVFGCPKVFTGHIPKSMAPYQMPLLDIAKHIGRLRYRSINMSFTDVSLDNIHQHEGAGPFDNKFALAGFGSQLFMGSAFTNTYPHKHEMVVQVNVVGRKRWFIDTRKYVDWDLCYKTDVPLPRKETDETAMDFLVNGRYQKWLEFGGDEHAQECTLEPAEIIVVPEQACHAIIDLTDSVAIAYEMFGNNFYWGVNPNGYQPGMHDEF